MIDPAAEGSASFLDRYRAGDLAPFFARPPGDLDAGLDRPPLDDPDGLAAALAVQARARGDRPGQLEAIERLRDPAARAIVTGQQAGLLLGPTFTLSKAITALQLARRLDRPERPVVAVFWVASQDHDAAEIDHAYLLDGDERLQRLALPFPEELPAGRAPWLAAWTERLDARLAQLAPHASGAPARELARAAYAHADTVADGFARLLSSLLGDQGLIVLDPMRPDVARRFAPVLHGDLRHPLAGPDAIRRAGTELRARGLRPQLGRGEDATNLFVQEAPDAPRKLLRFDGRRFHPDGSPASRWTRGDLEARLADDPLAITPAAGLRPVVQDAALPTAAIVVGPGELRYFAQLRGVYEHHEVPMPTVWPRAFATILEPPVARILARHGVRAADVAADPEGVLRERLLSLHGQAERFAAARERLEGDVAELLEATSDLDPTLAGPVRRGRRALDLTLCRLRIKAADALARRDRTTSAQFARLRAHLLPDGRPQERVLSPFSHFAKFGVDPVMARLRTLEPEGAQELAIDP